MTSTTIDVNQRERAIITSVGILPDIDGIGLLLDFINGQLGSKTHYWFQFHHQLHNLSFCLVLTGLSFYFAKTKKYCVATLAFLAFHLHLFCDLIGARGPDGYQWPLPYFSPFTHNVQLTWQHQWQLNAWPNIVIGLGLIGLIALVARKKRISPFEFISKSMNQAFLKIIK